MVCSSTGSPGLPTAGLSQGAQGRAHQSVLARPAARTLVPLSVRGTPSLLCAGSCVLGGARFLAGWGLLLVFESLWLMAGPVPSPGGLCLWSSLTPHKLPLDSLLLSFVAGFSLSAHLPPFWEAPGRRGRGPKRRAGRWPGSWLRAASILGQPRASWVRAGWCGWTV